MQLPPFLKFELFIDSAGVRFAEQMTFV